MCSSHGENKGHKRSFLKNKSEVSGELPETPCFFNVFYPRISSIYFNSSSVNAGASSDFTFSMICSGRDAPMITLVSGPRRFQRSAICASVWPRFSAMALSAFILSMGALLTRSAFKNYDFVAREPSGMPWRYLFVKSPCASGQNAIEPAPSLSRTPHSHSSGVRSNML